MNKQRFIFVVLMINCCWYACIERSNNNNSATGDDDSGTWDSELDDSETAPEMVAVPDVVGLIQSDAEAAINEAHLTIGIITSTASDNVQEDYVISQMPESGAMVEAETPVNIEVSLGVTCPIKIMTFNVRHYFGDADTVNQWDNRKIIGVNLMESFKPDLIGMQEAYVEQIDHFLNNLSTSYESIGIGREADGSGEHNNIFYDTEKFELLDSGTFWLSTTPEVPGSKHWQAEWPRICTWGKFKVIESEIPFYYYNTHYAYSAYFAMVFSSNLITDRIYDHADSETPVFVGGDLNIEETHQAFNIYIDNGYADSWQEAGNLYNSNDGTFHEYAGNTNGQHIDWILHRSESQIESTEIISYNENGYYPSDHFPVIAQMWLFIAQ